MGGPLALSLQSVEGLEPETVRARLEAGRGPLTQLVIDPPLDVGGRGRWLLIGVGQGGWTTRKTIDVAVHRVLEAKPERRPSPQPLTVPRNSRLRIVQ